MLDTVKKKRKGNFLHTVRSRTRDMVLSVPVRWKVIGIGLLPVVILGISLNYWIRLGLSDWLSYLLTDVRVDAAMAAGGRSVLFVTILAAFLSVFLSLFFSEVLTSPIVDLKKLAQKVAGGEYELRAEEWADDEIGSLATSINQMIENFVAVQEDLQRTNRHLQVMNRIAFAAERDLEIHDILFIILKNILEFTELQTGWVYLYDPELHRFHLASWYGVPDSLQEILLSNESTTLCKCQRALADNTLGDVIHISDCDRSTDGQHCSGRHVTIPIEARSKRFGLINLLCPGDWAPSSELLGILSSLGVQVSEIVANAWLQIQLSEKEAARQMLLESLVTAQESERKRLARELHDHAGQSLTNLLVRLKTTEQQCTQYEVRENLNDLLEVVASTIDQIRELSYQLRPPSLEEFGLSDAIQTLVSESAAEAGLEFEFFDEFDGSLSPEVEVMLYRIAQEGLTNIIRHSGARIIRIRLFEQSGQAVLMIEDDGKGFDPAAVSHGTGKRHLGLISMNERVELIGGKFHMYSSPEQGTRLEAHIPFTNTGEINQ